MASLTEFSRSLLALQSVFLILIAFLIPIGLLLNGSLESRCAYVIVSMAFLWFTEALPITVTAMMPMFLLPLLAVQPGKVVCGNYFNDTSVLFLVGLMMGVAMHEVNLHKRIAIGIIMLFGANPNSIMLGLMLSTWSLSMWISNVAATSMMLPILMAVIEQTTALDDDDEADTDVLNGDAHIMGDSKQELFPQPGDTHSEAHNAGKRLNKALTLSVAYGANIGGIAILNSSSANLVLQEQTNKYFKDYGAVESGLTYANWMLFAFPVSVIMLFLTLIWLKIVFIGFGKAADKGRQAKIESFFKQEYKQLGPIKFEEVTVLVMFVALALLLLSRDLPGVGGWGRFFLDTKGNSTATDSTAAILLGSLLFILPKSPNLYSYDYNSLPASEDLDQSRYRPILMWKVVEKKVAWGVLLLFGGGFALADASTTSGLSRLVGCELRVLKGLDPWVMNLVLSLISAAITEFISNLTAATLLIPLVAELATSVGLHPLYCMISVGLACASAFMLPVATPPNAIVFSAGTLRISDMALTGIVLNIIAVGVLTLAINTWGTAIFKLDTIPGIFLNATQGSTCSGI